MMSSHPLVTAFTHDAKLWVIGAVRIHVVSGAVAVLGATISAGMTQDILSAPFDSAMSIDFLMGSSFMDAAASLPIIAMKPDDFGQTVEALDDVAMLIIEEVPELVKYLDDYDAGRAGLYLEPWSRSLPGCVLTPVAPGSSPKQHEAGGYGRIYASQYGKVQSDAQYAPIPFETFLSSEKVYSHPRCRVTNRSLHVPSPWIAAVRTILGDVTKGKRCWEPKVDRVFATGDEHNVVQFSIEGDDVHGTEHMPPQQFEVQTGNLTSHRLASLLPFPNHWSQLTPLTNPPTLHERLVPIVFISGPKGAGKSTFSRYLTNSLLSSRESQSVSPTFLDRIFPYVAFLDIDLGQPEHALPGVLALSLVSRYILSPPHCRAWYSTLSQPDTVIHIKHPQSKPEITTASISHPTLSVTQTPSAHAAHTQANTSPIHYSTILEPPSATLSMRYLGTNSPKDDPVSFIAATAQLLEEYRHFLAPLGIPLVINSHGWTKGIGYITLQTVLNMVAPTHFISLLAKKSEVPSVSPASGSPIHRTVNLHVDEELTAPYAAWQYSKVHDTTGATTLPDRPPVPSVTIVVPLWHALQPSDQSGMNEHDGHDSDDDNDSSAEIELNVQSRSSSPSTSAETTVHIPNGEVDQPDKLTVRIHKPALLSHKLQEHSPGHHSEVQSHPSGGTQSATQAPPRAARHAGELRVMRLFLYLFSNLRTRLPDHLRSLFSPYSSSAEVPPLQSCCVQILPFACSNADFLHSAKVNREPNKSTSCFCSHWLSQISMDVREQALAKSHNTYSWSPFEALSFHHLQSMLLTQQAFWNIYSDTRITRVPTAGGDSLSTLFFSSLPLRIPIQDIQVLLSSSDLIPLSTDREKSDPRAQVDSGPYTPAQVNSSNQHKIGAILGQIVAFCSSKSSSPFFSSHVAHEKGDEVSSGEVLGKGLSALQLVASALPYTPSVSPFLLPPMPPNHLPACLLPTYGLGLVSGYDVQTESLLIYSPLDPKQLQMFCVDTLVAWKGTSDIPLPLLFRARVLGDRYMVHPSILPNVKQMGRRDGQQRKNLKRKRLG